MTVSITLLGTGSSTGVPELGCRCEVCVSPNPRNKRMRASALFEAEGRKILIDTSPDLRQQAIDNGIFGVDAILYTHAHADHTHGIDDVKLFIRNQKSLIPAYSDSATMAEIKSQFGYVFRDTPPEQGWYYPAITPHEIAADGEFETAGVKIKSFRQQHGRSTSLGFRIGDIAYSADCNVLPDSAFAALAGVEIWVVDCLRRHKAPTHAHLEITLGWIAQVKPKLAVLTHMSHDMDYDYLESILPDGVIAGYDGMTIKG